MEELQRSLSSFGPEIALTTGLVLVVLADALLKSWRNQVVRALTVLTLAGALWAVVDLAGQVAPGPIFSGMLAVDPLGLFFKFVLVLASFILVLAFTFQNSRELQGLGQGEFHALLLALTLGCLLMTGSNDIVMLYLSLETVSITSYIMVAYLKGDRLSNEAALKYLLFGAVSTGAMLYGLSLLFGLTGATGLPEIRQVLAGGFDDAGRLTLYLITALLVAGFGFKIAAVPFHFWCPDAYQGAPTPVTALLSVVPKAAGFGLLLRFFFGGMTTSLAGTWDLTGSIDWPGILMLVSVATMTVGNLAAITQVDMKRLLAYSSIAHAGYMLMGVVALSANGARGVMVYLLVYLFMNLGAFLVVTLIHQREGTFDLRDYPGMFKRQPVLSVAMSIFLLSLMGIPPLTGFMGKLYVFAAVIEKGPQLWWFAAVGAVNAAIAAWYYARVMRVMVIDESDEPREAWSLAPVDAAWLGALVAANLLPLLFWEQIEAFARGSLTLWAGM